MDKQLQRWDAMEAIFHEALAAKAHERAAIVVARADGDTTLMAELRSLLEACAAEEVHRLGIDRQGFTPGSHVGPYVLQGLVGRGGMGAVYRAQRSDGQFEQQVAIKIVDVPLGSEYLRERFRAERQMLATMSHPYIARLLDGGVTEDGELYLAMEYIDGVCVTDFCQRRGLGVEERVRLFARICEAVQYAHRNLIVHRDLKPENILAVEDGTPRLLDFGTAKMIQPLEQETDSNATRLGMQAFTPQYASPEQVLGQPISIATDIYSLGVLLYVLLTGKPPYELTAHSTGEMVRVICHEVPKRPSIVAEMPLDADLDAIVMMALRKEPGQRYATVEQMAADLEAWLQQRPVLARRGNVRYRAGRFIRRNSLAVAGAAVLGMTALLGVAGIAWQAHVARVERQRAEAQSANLRQLSVSLLTELDDAIKQLPGSTNVQRLLVTQVLGHLDLMAQNSVTQQNNKAGRGVGTGLDMATALSLADAYTRMANLEGNPYDQNIGDQEGARRSASKAVGLARRWKEQAPVNPAALHAFAFARQSESEILFGMKRLPEAVEAMREAAAAYATLAERQDATPTAMSDASSAYGALGDEEGMPGKESLGHEAAALLEYRKALQYQRRALALDPQWPRSLRTLPVALMKLGNMEATTDPWDAMRQYRAGLKAMEQYPAAERGGAAYKRLHSFLWRRLSVTFEEVGLYPQALDALREARTLAEAEVRADRVDVRSLIDLQVALDNEAVVYEALASKAGKAVERERYRIQAQATLQRMQTVSEEIVRKSPQAVNDRENLANTQVRLGTLMQDGPPGTVERRKGAQLSAAGIAELKRLGENEPASGFLDTLLATTLITVKPESLRDAGLAVHYAERAAQEAPQRPSYWAHLAAAYQAAGALAATRQRAAGQGLALMAPVRPGEARSATRIELEAEAR